MWVSCGAGGGRRHTAGSRRGGRGTPGCRVEEGRVQVVGGCHRRGASRRRRRVSELRSEARTPLPTASPASRARAGPARHLLRIDAATTIVAASLAAPGMQRRQGRAGRAGRGGGLGRRPSLSPCPSPPPLTGPVQGWGAGGRIGLSGAGTGEPVEPTLLAGSALQAGVRLFP